MLNLSKVFNILTGKTAGSVDKAIKELRKELLGADIDEEIVSNLIKRIKERINKEKVQGFTEKDIARKIIFEELKEIFGEEKEFNPIKFKKILLVGLYGAGKTTSAAKLGWYLKSKGFDPVLIEADTFRKGSYEQAKQLCERAGIKFYGNPNESDPIKIIEEGLKIEGTNYIVDTAGRDGLKEELIQEINKIYDFLKPDLTLLVIPSDISTRVAAQFVDKFKFDGVIITKMDGVGKGGAILTILKKKSVPVYFIGAGEKIYQFVPFSTKEYVANLFGLPDFESLIKKIEIAKSAMEEIDTNKYTLEEFIKTIKSSEVGLDLMGSDMLNMFKGMFGLSKFDIDQDDLQMIYQQNKKKFIAIYNSMTNQERKNPEIVLKEKSRITRIAKGSGTTEDDVKLFINQYLITKKLVENRPRNMFDMLKRLKGFKDFRGFGGFGGFRF
jgi:signal recognition particle subunit SRP54